ncbi:MAG: type II 3-dehydroquinate dehydratase [Helicobacteraceae bacterium]
MKISVIQGPNLNILGHRENNLYGTMTIDAIHEQMQKTAGAAGLEIEFFQSNLEGELVDKIQECLGDADIIIINPAAYTHTSVAIRDALLGVQIPAIEVHITNPQKRENFRKKSFISDVCIGTISGFGPFTYHLAMIAAIQIAGEIQKSKK